MEFACHGNNQLTVRFEASDSPHVRETTVRALGFSCVDTSAIKHEANGEVVEAKLAGDTSPDAAILLVEAALHSPDIGLTEEVPATERVDIFDDGMPFVFGAHQLS